MIVFSPKQVSPSFVEFETVLKRDVSVMILGNLITMTPGTLTVDFDQARRVLLIHVLEVGDIEVWRAELRRTFEEPIRVLLEDVE
jgi:multicomponent K+:H+ antiporter subunit E